MLLSNGDVLLRPAAELKCTSVQEAREFHALYPTTTQLHGSTVKFLRATRIPKPIKRR